MFLCYIFDPENNSPKKVLLISGTITPIVDELFIERFLAVWDGV